MRRILIFGFLLSITACQQPIAPTEIEAEIRQAEAAFNEMAKEEGLKNAFLHFAAEEAALIRGNQVVTGTSSIASYLDQPTGLQDVSLTWAPDRIIVSEAGDMAYSFGKYQFSGQDTSGQVISSEGIFRTLWKRQADGQWRYLVD